jgi:hypothetical protein
MEKIVSKTNETSNLVALADSELDVATGGMGLGPMWFQVQAIMELMERQNAPPPCGDKFNSLGHPTNPC